MSPGRPAAGAGSDAAVPPGGHRDSGGAARQGVRVADLPGRPGEVMVAADPVVPASVEVTQLTVENTSAWPVVITSHFHFFEANRRLRFDRARAFGCHLDVLAGGAVRFAPGETKQVALVPYAGDRAVYGFNGLTNAVLGTGEELERQRAQALARLRAAGYLDTGAGA
jgi:urease beta subunit